MIVLFVRWRDAQNLPMIYPKMKRHKSHTKGLFTPPCKRCVKRIITTAAVIRVGQQPTKENVHITNETEGKRRDL